MKKIAIGLMSGTSLDGIDVLLASIEGSFKETKTEILAFETIEYSTDIKEKLNNSMDLSLSNVSVLTSLNFELGYLFSEAVNQLLKKYNIPSEKVDFIASHGQTIYHIPFNSDELKASTLQLGDGSVIANLTGIKTVYNFRTADMAAGGQGAPLVPYADYCLFNSSKKHRILLNIGGIANITYLMKNGSLDEVIAFDTGPGNMIIDAFMNLLFNQSFDKDGLVARSGQVIDELIDQLKKIDFIYQQPPKSTGRELFGLTFSKQLLQTFYNHRKEDLIRTVTEFSAWSIGEGCKLLNIDFKEVELIVSGGGARNKFLLELVKKYIRGIELTISNDYGIEVDQKEALAFIVLANETLQNKPSNVPSATGATKPVILGQICIPYKESK
ncbi:MAG: anhydro-N-acetylmuramic acid kinase AnmK [Acholeplasmataceae bacterium]|nr:anhydro-N-acetylmuramic acid kinase AnmK [Acholeplasmataceae bacterium]